MAQTLIEGVTNYWCRTKGIHSKDLEIHPQMDDVILLIKYRDSMWNKLNRSEQAHFGAVWSWCYHNKFALKQKHLKKLELITTQATTRYLKTQIQLAKARQKIRQLRQTV
jgi:hypothetical protein